MTFKIAPHKICFKIRSSEQSNSIIEPQPFISLSGRRAPMIGVP